MTRRAYHRGYEDDQSVNKEGFSSRACSFEKFTLKVTLSTLEEREGCCQAFTATSFLVNCTVNTLQPLRVNASEVYQINNRM